MVIQKKDNGFLERRKSSEEFHSILSGELSELNRRRDDNLRSKLSEIEKYFHLYVSTKSDAFGIAITRIQGDSSACFARCNKQVAEFYSLISEIQQNQIREFEKFKAYETHSAKYLDNLSVVISEQKEKTVTLRKELDDKIDSLEKDTETDHNLLKTRFTVLENWKELNWKQTLIWGAAALVGLMQILNWLHDKFSLVK